MKSSREEKQEFYLKLLENERRFHRLFCDVEEHEYFSMYHNRSFADDPIFNHFILSERVMMGEDSHQMSRAISSIRASHVGSAINASIFVENFWSNSPNFEKVAIENGYRITGQMEILAKKLSPNDSLPKDQRTRVETTKDIDLWNELFMSSFSIPASWREELRKRLRIILENKSASLIVASEIEARNLGQGVLLTYIQPTDIMGVYCVGTDPRWRGRGIARAMMTYAERSAREVGCRFITLQTLSADGVAPMYKKMGYVTEFVRDLLWSPA